MKSILLFVLFVLLSNCVQAQSQRTTAPTYMPHTIQIRMKSYTSIDDVRQILAPFGASPIRQMLQPLQSITYSPNTNRRMNDSRENFRAIVDAESPVLRTFVVHFTPNQTPQKYCLNLLRNCASVELAEPSVIESTMSIPNDSFTSQQGLLGVIKAFEAWDITKGDESVVIGICDNGVYQDHEDLTNSIAVNTAEIPNNGIDDDHNGYIDDYRGVNITANDDATKPGVTFCNDNHGSCVAGIAGATTNNSIGISGVGYKCKIFPIKTGFLDQSGVFSGYEGLIYAAVRGFKVVNCSWGSPNSYSKINESIIRYVQSRDVAIVVAAGNNTGILPWYPAGYEGVLGVGETDIADEATQGSAVGAHSSIMAPGNASFATTNKQNDYTQNFGGSSASAPIVSGVVAIVRSYYPQLTARQAIEHVRLTADNIEKQNQSLVGLIAGRVNMLRAVTEKPLDHPSLRPLSWDLRSRGLSTTQFYSGDTVSLSVVVKNYLAPSGALTATLSVKDQFFPFILLDSVVAIPSIESNATATIATYRFIIPSENSELTFLRINIKGAAYNDFFLIPFHPTPDMATFSNDSIAVSLGSEGQFGFAGRGVTWHGIGLSYGEFGNQLYFDAGTTPEHCFIITDGDNRVESASVNNSDFTTLKSFTSPEPTSSSMSDSLVESDSRIGVEVSRRIELAPGNAPAFKILYSVKNVSGATIKDISVGQYLDFDIGAYGFFNYARLFTEAVPVGINGAAEIIGRDGIFDLGGGKTSSYPLIGCLVLPISPNGIPQMAGINVGDSLPSGLTSEKKISFLNNGVSIQPTIKGDIAIASGMKFPGDFLAGDTRKFEVCYGGGMTKELLAQTLLKCAGVSSVREPSKSELTKWNVVPNPVNDELTLYSFTTPSLSSTVVLTSLLGEQITKETFLESSHTLTTAHIPSGVYYLQIESGSWRETVKIIVVH